MNASFLRAQLRGYDLLDSVTHFFTCNFPKNIYASDTAFVWPLAIVSLVSLALFTLGGFGVHELCVAVLLKQCYGRPAESAMLLSLALSIYVLIASVDLGDAALLGETVFTGRKGAKASGQSLAK